MLRSFILTMALMALTTPARAALYEFTLTGEVRGSSLKEVGVGDPLLMRFVADSNDSNPAPDVGRYAAGDVTMTFPNSLFTEIEPAGWVEVQLAPLAEGYIGFFRVRDPAGFFFTADFVLSVGAGIFPSDDLPLTLPIPLKEQMLFHLSLGVNPNVSGIINSYSTRAIPELGATNFIAVCAIMAMRRRTRPRKSR